MKEEFKFKKPEIESAAEAAELISAETLFGEEQSFLRDVAKEVDKEKNPARRREMLKRLNLAKFSGLIAFRSLE